MGIIVEGILTILQRQAEFTAALFDALSGGKQASRRKFANFEAVLTRNRLRTDWAVKYRERQKFYAILNQLKREGLIAKYKDNERTVWKITARGKDRLKFIRKRKNDPLKFTDYPKLRGEGMTVVSFDIPEIARKKRAWCRNCLKAMGLHMLQQSLWIGKGTVDENFIRALRERNMLPYIQIFSVSRAGTIREFGKQ